MAFMIVLVGFVVGGNAQDNLVGIRGGWYNGVSFQHYLDEGRAVEGLFQFTQGGINLTGLYEFHEPINDTQGFGFYYGAGAHVGTYKEGRYNMFGDRNTISGAVLGIDGIVGIEYILDAVPLQLSIDYKPALNIGGGDLWLFHDTALGIRIYF